ncbi:putative RNA-directed DNA polymerase from transposon BS [Stylophora pistillata]|uniref:Putative RNA-directed DNA polymerase from transposon BS n=1 Tax=Stylophora pistillata TaxID=50429 RepID=A0A2B4R7L1_STYPI|nr:putative RNA-directed DNA polymerase from transposon BS [Stylophora pistillata]
MVDREILLQKLNAYGLTPVARKWFSSYLTDRHQFIALDNVTSDSALVRHGVPQGSILGPLLFVIYINDLPLHVNGADLDLYADDTTLTLSADISAVDSLQDSLAASLKEIECWTHTNKLPLNEKKTKTLLVTGKRLGKKLPDGYNLSLKTMNGVSLEQVPSAKLLGGPQVY